MMFHGYDPLHAICNMPGMHLHLYVVHTDVFTLASILDNFGHDGILSSNLTSLLKMGIEIVGSPIKKRKTYGSVCLPEGMMEYLFLATTGIYRYTEQIIP